MLATEQHARHNWWCPMMRYRNPYTSPHDTGYNITTWNLWKTFKSMVYKTFFPRTYWYKRGRYGMCMGSGCSLWRWADAEHKHGWCGAGANPTVLN